MEDAHISSTDLAPLDDEHVHGDNVAVFGVFDGHGGLPLSLALSDLTYLSGQERKWQSSVKCTS